MSIIKPFRAWRPRPDIAHLVACRPYDVMNRSEAKAEANGNPYSFLHVIRAEIDLSDKTNDYDEAVYRKAIYNFNRAVKNAELWQEQSE